MASLQYACRLTNFIFFFLFSLPPQDFIFSAADTSSFPKQHSYPAIFVFGDSLSDTGNAAIIIGNATSGGGFHVTERPYGETFPGWPSGRYSDGRVVIDFLASYLGLPLLNPFLNNAADFGGGVNYAVGGATALDVSLLHSLNIYPATNLSLDVQLSWHLAYKAKVESSTVSLPGSRALKAFEDGLYVIEIGGNDYINAFIANYSLSFVNNTLVPLVLQRVFNTVEVLLNNGAKRFLFISLTPLGCTPFLLTLIDGFKDDDGCLEDYNLVASLYGAKVQDKITSLRISYSHATFSFMDYFGAYNIILKSYKSFGFMERLRACCGAGYRYPYNFDPYNICNDESVSLCVDPGTHFSWDGIHPTESLNLHAFNLAFNISSFAKNQHDLF